MRKIFKIIMVLIGTLIGAGFASGREIYLFFSKYNIYGIFGILLFGVLIGIIIYCTFKISHCNNIEDYDSFIGFIKNKNTKNNKSNKCYFKIVKILLNNIINIFLLMTFYIMVAGFSSFIKQEYNISTYISSIAYISIVYIVLSKDIKGLFNINTILVPVIILIILLLGFKSIDSIDNIFKFNDYFYKSNFINESNLLVKSLISSILYTSYNCIILIPTVISLSKYIKNKKEIKRISIITSICFVLLTLCIFLILNNTNINVETLDMPILKIILDYGVIKKIYEIIIVFSIFTSTISVGYSYLINNKKIKYKNNLLLICLSSILISNIGFSKLVSIIYPIFGLIGIVQLVFICKKSLEKSNKN